MEVKEFLSHLRVDSHFIPFADDSCHSTKEPSKEQMEEVATFLKALSDVNDDI